MITYKKYDEQLKKQMVKLHIEGRTISELGVEDLLRLFKWIKIYSTIGTTPAPKNSNEIYRENKRLKQEIDIVKQAMFIMTAK